MHAYTVDGGLLKYCDQEAALRLLVPSSALAEEREERELVKTE
jgi:hypothetical protein